MPNMDGFQFLSRLRAESDIPVIMITAKQQEVDIVHGFELGADDYITKPFRLRSCSRIRAVMRRVSSPEGETPNLTVGEITLNCRDKHEVFKAGETIDLTPVEFYLLEMLMNYVWQGGSARPNEPISD